MHMEVIESYRKDKPIRQLNSLKKVLKSLKASTPITLVSAELKMLYSTIFRKWVRSREIKGVGCYFVRQDACKNSLAS